MPSSDEIQHYLTGAWRMMMGKADGLRLLDLSADGFWNSFFAIVVALPALIVGWVGVANELSAIPRASAAASRSLLRLAAVDLAPGSCRWSALPLVAPRAGIGDRFVHYVVASNWGSALIVWMMLPAALLRLFLPSTNEFAVLLLSLALVRAVDGADLADDQCRDRQGARLSPAPSSPACSWFRWSCCSCFRRCSGLWDSGVRTDGHASGAGRVVDLRLIYRTR